jgi:hypothetical protein
MSYATIRQSRFTSGDVLLCDFPFACGWRIVEGGIDDSDSEMTWASPAMWMHCAQCECEIGPYDAPLYGLVSGAFVLISNTSTYQNSLVTLSARSNDCWVGRPATYTCNSAVHLWQPTATTPRGECVDFRKDCAPGYRPYLVAADKVELCLRCTDDTYSALGRACVQRTITECPDGYYILRNNENTAEHRCIQCQQCLPPETMIMLLPGARGGCTGGVEMQPYLCITNLDSIAGLRATLWMNSAGISLSYERCPAQQTLVSIAGPLPDTCYYAAEAETSCPAGHFTDADGDCLPCVESSCDPDTEVFISITAECRIRSDVCRVVKCANDTYFLGHGGGCLPCEYAKCAPGQRLVCAADPCVYDDSGSASGSGGSSDSSGSGGSGGSNSSCPLGSYGDGCFACPFTPNRFFVSSSCGTECIAGTYSSDCLPCPAVTFINAPFSSYAYALFNATPGRRWW